MRYVPDIIPAEHKIRPDYFKGGPPITATENVIRKVLYVAAFIAGAFFMMGGIGLLLTGQFLAGVFLWLSGLMVFPMGFGIIQSQFRAPIPGWLRFVFAFLLLVIAAIVSK
ncbi:MAG TPA: hypothetical protein VK154_15925 [Chitinophagales bacterium]|nr:hypothetical protein [Chitinophagales bacterium]